MDFNKFMMLAMVLDNAPGVLKKRIIKKMIDECDIGMSAEEVSELEKMYDVNKQWISNGGFKMILEIMQDKFNERKFGEALIILNDIHSAINSGKIHIIVYDKDKNLIADYLKKIGATKLTKVKK